MRDYSAIRSDWKKRAKPDYFGLFMATWISFEAWMTEWGIGQGVSENDNQRNKIDKVKDISSPNNPVFVHFQNFIESNSDQARMFREYLVELDKAMKALSLDELSIEIKYRDVCKANTPRFRQRKNILEKKEYLTPTKSRFLEDWEISFLFRALIEILYQIRNKFFHGNIQPDAGHERVLENAQQILYRMLP